MNNLTCWAEFEVVVFSTASQNFLHFFPHKTLISVNKMLTLTLINLLIHTSVFHFMYLDYASSPCLYSNIVCQLYVSVPTCIYCLASCTVLSSVWVRLHICHCGSLRRSVWQMSPSLLAGDSLRGGENFCASKRRQSCVAPWWETGPRHLIDWQTNMRRWLWTPQAQKHKDRGRAAPRSTHRKTLGHTERIAAH